MQVNLSEFNERCIASKGTIIIIIIMIYFFLSFYEKKKIQTEINESPRFRGSFHLIQLFYLFYFFSLSTAIWCAAPRWNQMNLIHVALHLNKGLRALYPKSDIDYLLSLIFKITTYDVLLLCLISVLAPPRFILFFIRI